jgi:hypothetical protein
MSSTQSAIESTLVENRFFNPDPVLAKTASISSMAAYEALCKEAETDYEGFWARLARENLSWKKPFTQTLDESDAPFYKWFADGQLNASYNCLDRHLGTPTEHQKAIIFESDDGKVTNVTYKELHAKVQRTPWCLAVFLPRACKSGFKMLVPWRLSRPITNSAAAKNCPSKPSSTKASPWAVASRSKTSLFTSARPQLAPWWKVATA